MTWLDTTIVVIIVAVGLVILYRGLKEPLDLLFGLIARGFAAIRDKVIDSGGSQYEEIRYG